MGCWICGSTPTAACAVIPPCWAKPGSRKRSPQYPELRERDLLKGTTIGPGDSNNVSLCPTCEANFSTNPPNVFFLPTDLDIFIGWEKRARETKLEAWQRPSRAPDRYEYQAELRRIHGHQYPEYAIYVAREYRPRCDRVIGVPDPLGQGRKWKGSPIAAILKTMQVLQKPTGLPQEMYLKLAELSYLWFIENFDFRTLIKEDLDSLASEAANMNISKSSAQQTQASPDDDTRSTQPRTSSPDDAAMAPLFEGSGIKLSVHHASSPSPAQKPSYSFDIPILGEPSTSKQPPHPPVEEVDEKIEIQPSEPPSEPEPLSTEPTTALPLLEQFQESPSVPITPHLPPTHLADEEDSKSVKHEYDSDLETHASSSSSSSQSSSSSDDDGDREEDGRHHPESIPTGGRPPFFFRANPATTPKHSTHHTHAPGASSRNNNHNNAEEPVALQMNLNAAHLVVSMEFKDVNATAKLPMKI